MLNNVTLFSTFITFMKEHSRLKLTHEPSLARSRAYSGAICYKRGYPCIRKKVENGAHVSSPAQRGFTLVEILIALMIFAIMGVLAAMSLHSIIRTHEKLKMADQKLLQLQITMTLLRRDISAVVDRKIFDSHGNQDPAFFGSGGSDITFTRIGLINPFNTSRQSNMQRVGYALNGDHLVRLTWDVLDQPPGAEPKSQTLLSGVQSIEWQFIADDGATSASWPPATGSNMQKENQSDLPAAVLMVMHIKHEGVLQGVFPVPARGAHATSQITLP